MPEDAPFETVEMYLKEHDRLLERWNQLAEERKRIDKEERTLATQLSALATLLIANGYEVPAPPEPRNPERTGRS
ncbi:MAG: hypothetical protein AAB289_04060, partial [Chloroflexota bacterium]